MPAKAPLGLKRFVALLALALATLHAKRAFAYRPFDGTDGDVATEGEFELEIGPIFAVHESRTKELALPATVFNFGVAKGVELVVDTTNQLTFDPAKPARDDVVDTDAFLKVMLREGVLQQLPGPSIATEFGVLVPTLPTDTQPGLSANVITSDVLGPLTFHWNLVGMYTRTGAWEGWSSFILEGPREWKVRPVAELLIDREFEEREWLGSGLVGAIYQASESFAVDVAARGVASEDRGFEVRAGLTWGLELWKPQLPAVTTALGRALP